jgi:hypothetical protein
MCNLSSRLGTFTSQGSLPRDPNTPSTCSTGTVKRNGKPTKICLEFQHTDSSRDVKSGFFEFEVSGFFEFRSLRNPDLKKMKSGFDLIF